MSSGRSRLIARTGVAASTETLYDVALTPKAACPRKPQSGNLNLTESSPLTIAAMALARGDYGL
jgi:hypothetical protein